MKRDPYYDFLRGLAIVAVIGIHTIINPESYDSFMDILTITIRQSLGAAVPLFLAISGYFLYWKKVNTKEDYFAFLKKQVPVVYFPMLIWSIPWLLLRIISGDSIFVLIPLTLVGGLSIFYFVTLIIECYIFLPLFKRISLRGTFLLLVVSILWLALMAYLRWWKMYDLPMVAYCFLPGYAVFYGIGCLCAKQKVRFSFLILLSLSAVFLVEQVVETIYLSKVISSNTIGIRNTIGLKIFTPLFSSATILLLFNSILKAKFKLNFISKVLVSLGEHSFTIYLTHLFVWFMLSRIVSIDYWALRWFILIVVDFAFVLFIQRIIPQKFHIYMGIR